MSANYWASTQCNNWLLDRPQLELARKEDLRYASRTECAAIGVFFSTLLSTICKRLNLRQRVIASANVFLRRFFCKNSYSALDPFLVSATCVYVAAKVEESPIHIKSAVAEATRSFQEVGFRCMPTDNSSVAEMEFYLLEEMEFDMILFHPYRSLLWLFDAFGTRGECGVQNAAMAAEADAFGVVHALVGEHHAEPELEPELEQELEPELEPELEAEAEAEAKVRLVEFDTQVLQLSWFVLNDTYKTDIPLMYAPYMVALASLWLALTLHTASFERINTSLHSMQLERHQHQLALTSMLDDAHSCAKELRMHQPSAPPQDALTWFASLNVSLALLAEVVQEMVSGYEMQNRVARLVADGAGMVKLLERMRESRRLELMAK